MDHEEKRMRWASRRGMLELDLILEPFLRDCFATLTDLDKARYRALMESQDQDLFAWFMKKEVPTDPELRSIVDTILLAIRQK
ncbi:MAG: succinate dehydrogenase assembly factor 2 [Congregibacter sp.]